MNDKFKRLIATLVASLGLFAFAACNTGDNGETPVPDSANSGNVDSDGKDDDGKDDDGKEDGGKEDDTKPVVPTVPKGAVKITEAAGDLEAAYVVWDKVEGAMGYNVYCKIDGGEYVQLDAPLVREYKDYCRADAVGLKAGKYTLKVVPTGGADYTEDDDKAATATEITVLSHDRSGYAFADGNVPGAYNADGTLKSGAQVVYVTAKNAKTVTATVNGAVVTGFQSILDARKQSSEPLCFRIVGTVNKSDLDHISSNAEGIQIKGMGTVESGKATSNITVEGVGSDGTVNGFGFLIRNCDNVELRNFGIVNFMDDGVSVDTGNSHLWMHNLDIFYGNAGGDSDQAKGDGSLDIKKSTYCTVSYNHFWDSGKCCLLDASAASDGEGSDYITYHHNWFDHSDSRHARVRNSTHTHIYNNYFDGNSKYGVGAAAGSTVFVENNYFRSTATMTPMIIGMQAHDIKSDGGSILSKEVGGMIKAFGNKYDCLQDNLALTERTKDSPDSLTDFDCYTTATREEQIPSSVTTKGNKTYNNFDTASDFYEYEADTPDVAKEKIELYAGRIGGGDLQWDFDDTAEDGNYNIIPELKSAVTNYKSAVVKIGGEAVGGGTATGGEDNTEGGGEEEKPVGGEISFIPTSSGSGFNVSGTTKSHSAIEIDGVSIAKNSALKMNSGGSVSFTTEKDMTLYLYLLNESTVKVDDDVLTPVQSGNCYLITASLKAGDHLIKQGSGENALYLIKLVPTA